MKRNRIIFAALRPKVEPHYLRCLAGVSGRVSLHRVVSLVPRCKAYAVERAVSSKQPRFVVHVGKGLLHRLQQRSRSVVTLELKYLVCRVRSEQSMNRVRLICLHLAVANVGQELRPCCAACSGKVVCLVVA